MKPWILALLCSALLGGCTLVNRVPVVAAPVLQPAEPAQLVDANGVPIERVPFRAGISSATVEKMARVDGCVGGQGAGLVTEPGPVEVYRIMCDNGQVYRARCELRQCKRM